MLGGKRGQQVPRAAGLRPGDPPPPRAGPSPDAHPHQLAGSSARWTWPGPPRCPPPPAPARARAQPTTPKPCLHPGCEALALKIAATWEQRQMGGGGPGRQHPGTQLAGSRPGKPAWLPCGPAHPWQWRRLATWQAGPGAAQPHLLCPRPKPPPWSVACAVGPLGLTPALLLTAHRGQVP